MTHILNPILRTVLNQFDQPAEIGTIQPLATPALLGHWYGLYGAYPNERQRGQIIQLVVAYALLGETQVRPEQPHDLAEILQQLRAGNRDQRLVYWRFLHEHKLPVHVLIDELGLAKATFHRDMKDRLPLILDQAADCLLSILQPALQLERPPVPAQLYGRAEWLAEAHAMLNHEHQVCIIGSTGVGKSACAATLANTWQGPVFWLTLLPDLNDQVESCLPLIGAFLQHHGAYNLAQHLAIEGGKLNSNVALGLIRRDCASLATPALFCLDQSEVMLKQPQAHHSALHSFWRALAAIPNVHVLIIGNRVFSDDLPVLSLEPLENSAFRAWFDATTTIQPDYPWEQFLALIAGNTHLMRIVMVLIQQERSLAAICAMLEAHPGVSSLIERIITMLGPSAQQLLTILASFQQPVPRSLWPSSDLQQLEQYQLLQAGYRDTLELWPLLRKHYWQQLSSEQRQPLHEHAAQVHALLGQWTLAAEHAIAAGDYAQAIVWWFPQRHSEIRAGYFGRMLRMLQLIPLDQLPAREAQTLAIGQAELARFIGSYDQARAGLAAVSHTGSDSLRAYIRQLEGDLWEAQGQIEQAMQSYERAITILDTNHYHQEAILYVKRGLMHLNHERDFEAAHQAEAKTHFIAALLSGEIADEEGNYDLALQGYQTALEHACTLNDQSLQARAHASLAIVHARNERTEAIEHFNFAIRYYQSIGNNVRAARNQSNLAYFLGEINQPHESITIAQEAYSFFKQINSQFWVSLNTMTLANAHVALNQCDDAERYAQEVLHYEETAHVPFGVYILGRVANLKHEFAMAERYLHQSVQLSQAIQDRFMEAKIWRELTKLFYATQRYSDAQHALTQASDLYQQLGLHKEFDRIQHLAQGFNGQLVVN
ncbi:tetratricopeptide repeat protein [Herpetosiphon llansteffanensis]|uniref:tetratricopeptide repeat protein n=1 Tax=Herpetosiphon llansteffanensis TaxID=2094568 RepID=UPI000D7CFAAA|nr:tetratricopeptide repeat protein [Herpetosiphon llansteffanensis]